MAYGLDKGENKNQKVLIYDLGGGTFDVSILEIGDGVFEVLATNGNTHLGGDDFDQCIIDYVVSEFKRESGVDLSGDRVALQRIKEAAEKAKIELSGVTKTSINLPYISANADGPLHIDMDITKAKFDALTEKLVEATIIPTKKAMSDAGLSFADISKVILVGGSTRIPAVVDAVRKLSGKEPYKGINPDECVAIGAAIQAGVLAGDVKDVLLLDVTPLSLGIETMGGVFTRLIDRNTTIPTSKTQVFSTAADNQPGVEIHVLQGEREFAKDNKTLGRFTLDGIPPAPRGVPQIEVTFDIDANGIVNVKARDKGTNKEQSVTITASTNLSESDIDKAVKEAEQYAEEDKKRRELVDLKNTSENTLYAAEKTVREGGEAISPEDRKTVEDAAAKARAQLDSTDIEVIKKAMEEFNNTVQPIFTKLYQQAQASGATGTGPDDNGDIGGDGTVEESIEGNRGSAGGTPTDFAKGVHCGRL